MKKLITALFLILAFVSRGQCVIVDCSLTTRSIATSLNSQITNITVGKTRWKQILGTGANITDSTASNTTVSNIGIGTNVFRFNVTSSTGTNYTANDTVVVLPPAPPSVTIKASSLVTSNTYDTLTAIASDSSGSIKSYGWGQISSQSPKAVINGAYTSQAIITGLYPGIWSFKVTVTSTTGLTANATISITVNSTAHIIKVVIYYDDGRIITQQ